MADEQLDRLQRALANRYAIQRELGSGGMATVYLAEDLKHKRKVAVKVLRPELAAVLGAERFVQEITTTANLQHPHILPLFDSGETDGFLYYVMPFIDGETLRDKLNRETQLGIEEAVRITTDVADALGYAHRNNVIHRDIKPENILLHDGRPMVADFGIALAVSAAAGGRMTETGLSLGTPHYMSPEQATAEKDITHRSDIYSLGSVLYEMLTGSPPHVGSSAQQIIMKIVTEEVRPVANVRKAVPPNVAAALAKALEKLPADRFETAAVFAEGLTNPAFRGPDAQATTAGDDARVSKRAAFVGAAFTAVVAASAVWMVKGQPAVAPEVVRFAVDYPAGYEAVRGAPPIAISPDGRLVVFAARDSVESRLFVRGLDEFEAVALPGTEGAHTPFFSPDGAWIGYLGGRAIYKIAVTGGQPVFIADAPFVTLGAAWAPGTIVVSGVGSGLMKVSDAGGTLERLTRPDDLRFQNTGWPNVLPDGEHVMVTVTGGSGERTAIVSIATGELSIVEGLQGVRGARLLPGNRLVYAVRDELLVAPFDWKRRTLAAQAQVMQNDVFGTGGGPLTLFSYFAVAKNGTLAYVPGGFEAALTYIVWVDRSGRSTPVVQYRGEHLYPHLSPDGRHVAVQEGTEIWVYDTERGTRTRLTQTGGTDPVWSPDGRRVTFAAVPPGSHYSLHSVAADGSDTPRFLFTAEHPAFPHSWSPDGEALAFYQVSPSSARDILVMRPEGSGFVADSFLVTQYNERSPVFSRDGRWIAYVSDESGTDEIYVRPYPGPGGKWTISRGGGREPIWGRDGWTLYFRRGTQVLAVPMVLRADELIPGEPTVAISGGVEFFSEVSGSQTYDVSPNGRRFLMVEGTDVAAPRSLRVVVGWMGR